MLVPVKDILLLCAAVCFVGAIILFVVKNRKSIYRKVMLRFFDSIGDGFFQIGTKERIFELDREIYGQTEKDLIEEVQKYYNQMKSNVDKYLDRFYSFKGQKEQIVNWFYARFSGDVDKDETKMKLLYEMLDSMICPDYDLNQQLKDICSKANAKFNEEFIKILINNRVGMKKGKYAFQLQSAIDLYKDSCIPENSFDPIKVAGVSIATGIAHSIIADGVISSILDNIFPEFMVELLAGPIGIGFGIILGVLINYAGLKIDEIMNRAKHKDSLYRYIDSEKSLYLEIIDRFFHVHGEYAEHLRIGRKILPLSVA